MRPFFSYYGSKYRLCQQGFYPNPQKSDIVIEPFAGSACYSVFHEPDQAILIDIYKVITDIWNYLINATPSDIMQLPSVIIDIKELDALPVGAKNLISFWLQKSAFSPAKIIPTWYSKYKNQSSCIVWSPAVKKRIASQVEQIKGWQVLNANYKCLNQLAIDYKKSTLFIDPPGSGRSGRKYKHNYIDYRALENWINTKKDAQIIACENQDFTYPWANFNQYAHSHSMSNKINHEAYWTNKENLQQFKLFS